MLLRTGLGLTAGIVLILSSLAHAFLGWPPLQVVLLESGVDASIVGAVAAGWYFGSVAMLTFGVITLLAVHKMMRGVAGAPDPVRVVAVAYLAFGLAAFVVRDFNPHFLVFVATGVLLGAFAFPKSAERYGGHGQDSR